MQNSSALEQTINPTINVNHTQNKKTAIFRPTNKIAKTDYYLRNVCLSVFPSSLPHKNNSASPGRIFIKFGI